MIASKSARCGSGVSAQLRVVPRPRVVRQRPQRLLVVVCRRPLHRADADVAGGDAREHRALEHRLAIHRLAGRHDRQAARGRNAERVHRLADDVFAQHRPERGAAVAAARESRLPRPFQLDVQAIAGRRDLLAEQDGAAVAEGGEVAELVTGIRLRDRPRAVGQGIARENRGAFRALERLRIEPEHRRQRPVEGDEARLADRRRCRVGVEELRQLRVGVLEAPACHTTIIAGGRYDDFFTPAGRRQASFDGSFLRLTGDRQTVLHLEDSASPRARALPQSGGPLRCRRRPTASFGRF